VRRAEGKRAKNVFYSKTKFPSPSQASLFSSLFPLSLLSLSLSLPLFPLSLSWRERGILRQWKEGRWEGKGRKGERRKGEGRGGGEREREKKRKKEREERLKEKREGEGEGEEKRGREGVFIDNQRHFTNHSPLSFSFILPILHLMNNAQPASLARA
jgi:hypothetical protein